MNFNCNKQISGCYFQTGFPFDDSEPEDFQRSRNPSSFRHHLDDIASRHPEFAEHLRPWTSDFPSFRTQTTHRKRHPSGSCGEDDTRSQKSGFSTSSNESTEAKAERKIPVKVETESKRVPIPQYGLRNTVDLGEKQKQSLIDEQERGQRSMSAPPDHRSNQSPQRFVSRINIEPKMGGNTSTLPKQVPPRAPEPQKPNVRHIPIFVEGRDDPILPKDQTDHGEPANSKPSFFDNKFSGFVRRDPSHFEAPFTQHQFQQPESSSRQSQSSQPPQPPQPQEQAKPQPSPPQPQQKQAQPQPAKPQINQHDPIFKIQQIQKDVNALMSAVDQYNGTSKDKQYLYLDEMLTRNLLKLDNIETEGKDIIRQARKEAIKCIEKCISILESKVSKPAGDKPVEVQTELETKPNITSSEEEKIVERMEVEPNVNEEPKSLSLEVGGAVRTGKEVKTACEGGDDSTVSESEPQNKKGKKNKNEKAEETPMEVEATTDTSQNIDQKIS